MAAKIRKSFAFAAMGCALSLALPAVLSAHEGDHDDGYVMVDKNTDTSNPNIKNLSYDFFVGSDSRPDYDAIWQAMEPTFKGTVFDKNGKSPFNPMLRIAEFTLNSDDVPEIIALPIEYEEHGNILCGSENLCPHYIIDPSKGRMKVIGVLRAFAVDRGEEIKNGYWTLKAFTKQADPKNFSHYDLYVFDRQKGAYARQDKPPAARPPKPPVK